MLVFVESWPAVVVPGLTSARVTGTVASMSQPAIFARTKAGHKCSKSHHSLWLFLTKVSGEPFITDVMLNAVKASASAQSMIWFFLIKN